MELTKNNFKEWSSELDRLMEQQHGIKKFSEVKDVYHWEKENLGMEPQEVIDDEVYHSAH